MENIEQPKPEPKGKSIFTIIFGSPEERALVSFALGCISVIVPIIIVLTVGRGQHAGGFLAFSLMVFYPIGLLSALLGLILGISGSKSTKKVFATTGVVLSLIYLLLPLLVVIGLYAYGLTRP